MTVQAILCRSWSEIPIPGFLTSRLNFLPYPDILSGDIARYGFLVAFGIIAVKLVTNEYKTLSNESNAPTQHHGMSDTNQPEEQFL